MSHQKSFAHSHLGNHRIVTAASCRAALAQPRFTAALFPFLGALLLFPIPSLRGVASFASYAPRCDAAFANSPLLSLPHCLAIPPGVVVKVPRWHPPPLLLASPSSSPSLSSIAATKAADESSQDSGTRWVELDSEEVEEDVLWSGRERSSRQRLSPGGSQSRVSWQCGLRRDRRMRRRRITQRGRTHRSGNEQLQ